MQWAEDGAAARSTQWAGKLHSFFPLRDWKNLSVIYNLLFLQFMKHLHRSNINHDNANTRMLHVYGLITYDSNNDIDTVISLIHITNKHCIESRLSRVVHPESMRNKLWIKQNEPPLYTPWMNNRFWCVSNCSWLKVHQNKARFFMKLKPCAQ